MYNDKTGTIIYQSQYSVYFETLGRRKVTVARECIQFVSTNVESRFNFWEINRSLNQQFVPYLFDTKIWYCSENGVSQNPCSGRWLHEDQRPHCDRAIWNRYVDVMFAVYRVRIAGIKQSCSVAHMLCNPAKESSPFSKRHISNSSLFHSLYCKMAFRNCEDVTGVLSRLM